MDLSRCGAIIKTDANTHNDDNDHNHNLTYTTVCIRITIATVMRSIAAMNANAMVIHGKCIALSPLGGDGVIGLRDPDRNCRVFLLVGVMRGIQQFLLILVGLCGLAATSV